MKLQRRRKPFLEILEDRTCPSVSVMFRSGALTLSGTPTSTLTVQETAPSVLQVTDGAKNLGSYRVTGDLRLNLTSHPAPVNVDVNGNSFQGNVYITLGASSPTTFGNAISVYSSTGTTGTVRGNVTIQGGNGQETFEIGLATITTPSPLTVRGSVSVYAKVSGGGFAGPGDTLFVGPGSTVLGSLTTTQVDNVQIDDPITAAPNGLQTVIGGTVTISDSGANAALSVHDYGKVNSGMSVIGTNLGDTFDLGTDGSAFPGTIATDLNVTLGTGGSFGNLINLEAGTSVNGNATLTSNAGTLAPNSSLITVAGAIGKSLAINLANGDTGVAFSGAVGNNMSVTGGSGNFDFGGGTEGGSFSGTVAGNLSFNLQNGDNTFDIVNAPGGTLALFVGHGNNTVTLDPATDNQVWNVNMNFGNGTDTLNLAGTGMNETLIGTIQGNGGTYTLNQGPNWTFGSPYNRINF